MKKGLLKSLLCFALAGTLLFGDAGLTLAAVSNDVQPATQTQQVKSSTAYVSSLSAYVDSYGSVRLSVDAYASTFDVFVNGVKYNTYSNYDNYGSESVAPWYSDYVYLYFSPQVGATYTIEVVPYTTTGTKGTSMTTTVKEEFPSNIYSSYAYGGQTPVYDANGLTTGYGKTYVYGTFYTYEEEYITYEIWRSDKKNGTYKKVATAKGYYNVSWSDNTATLGKTYYYKMRPVTTPDGTYITKEEYGEYSTPIEVELSKPSVSCYAAYTVDGVIVEANSHTLSTGFEVYRASKKSGKYSKIATISDTYYIDTTVKSGKTYYYKLKPFFYDTETKKTTYGKLSDAAGVKASLSSSYLEITQTAKNKVKLQWDKVKGAVAYEIYKKSDVAGEGYKYVTTTKKTSYTAKVTADAYTSFRVRAVKKTNSIKSEYLVMSAGINTGFTSPRNLEVSKKSASIKNDTMTIKTTLKWDKVYGAKKYRVEVYDNSKDEWVTFKTLSKTTITISNTKKLNEVWKYSDNVRVYAIKGDEEEYTSDYCLTDLAAVTNVKVTKNNATSAKITWKAVSGADTYTVIRRTPMGTETCFEGITKTSFVDKKLTPGVNYVYEVTASNSKYYVYSGSAYDADKEVFTNQAIYNHKSAAPEISSVSKKAKVTWKKVDGATQYVVYRATSKKGKYEKVGTSKTTSFTDKKAKSGKTYYYKVVAVTKNDAGVNVESAMSAYKSAKIKK